MLVITRKPWTKASRIINPTKNSLVLDTASGPITIVLIEVGDNGSKCRIGIDAPDSVKVYRSEIYDSDILGKSPNTP